MFSHPLKRSSVPLFRVEFTDYAEKHFLKNFRKKYPGRIWQITEDSIFQDLARLKIPDSELQFSQQVDELKHKGACWLFKYDFRVAKSKMSAKSSGNRCICFLDDEKGLIQILLIYAKSDLPKNISEGQFIRKVLTNEYEEIVENFGK